MTSNELKNKVLEANAKLDLCLSYLESQDLDMFIKIMKESKEALETCSKEVFSCKDEIETLEILASVIMSARLRANKYLNLSYRIFGTICLHQINAALDD